MRLAMLACLGTLACDASLENRERGEQEPALRDLSTLSGGGVELNTNIIRGAVRFTNQNPQVVSLLAEDPWRGGSAIARSTQPVGYIGSTSRVTFSSPTQFTFEMLVEAGAGGDNGVTYDVTVSGHNAEFPIHRNVLVKRRDLQPLPTEVTLEQCIGAVRFMAGTDATCTTPATLDYVDTHFEVYAKQGHYFGYVPDGYQQDINVSYTVTTVSGTTSGTRKVTVSGACDQIVPVCLPPPPPPPPLPLGELTGPWELIGEPVVVNPRVTIWGGPRNSYSISPVRVPSAPVGDPTTWWKTLGLPEGTGYNVATSGYLRSGRDIMHIAAPYLYGSATVVGNQLTPFARTVNGETQYPFVMRPAYFYGSVRLVDPYVSQNPGANSFLRSLSFADTDSDGDGVPDQWIGHTTHLRGVGIDEGYAMGAFRDRFDPVLGELSSNYELVLASPYNQTLPWAQDYLALVFQANGPNVAKYLGQSLVLQKAQRSALLGPGQRYRVDHEYCFNEVQIDYWTTLGRFFAPRASLSGGLTGTDWRGQQVSYSVSGVAQGTPLHPATAQQQGTIHLALPQGTFTLNPSAYMINAAGQENSANFAPLSMELGCGQRLRVVPPLTVSISPMTVCAQTASVPVSGVVSSAPAEVDRIWYRINGGPEVTLCTNCGTNPAFSFNAALQACGNEVEVFAFADGMQAPAMGYQQVTWDDPSDGPTCASYCVNQPPVARCRSVTVPLGSACGDVSGSVNDGSYDPDSGDTFTCTQTPEGPYSAGTRRVTLTCTDDSGLSSSCEATVSVVDTTPPVLTCPASTGPECGGTGDPSAGVSATDNCGATPAVTCTAGTSGPSGTPVTCTATDAAGNRATCQFSMATVDTTPPTLTLEGPEELVVQCGASATSGVVATDTCSGDLSHLVQPVGLGTVPGTYHISYRVTDPAGNSTQGLSRKVTVLPSGATSMTLLGDSFMSLECGVDTWTDPGATAADTCGSPLEVHKYNSGDDDGDGVPGGHDPDDHGPGPNTSAEGTYSVQYIAWDASGHTVSAIRTVQVDDRLSPALKLNGKAWMTHACGSPWVDPGVVATDACYGDVTRWVVKTGYVNGWVPGLYIVRYAVTDGGDNSAPPWSVRCR